MKNKSISHALREDVSFNPFNDKFDKQDALVKIKNYLEREAIKSEKKCNEDDKKALSILKHTDVFNSYHKSLYDYMKHKILNLGINPLSFTNRFFSFVNQDTVKITLEIEKKIEEVKELKMREMSSFEVESAYFSSGKMNAIGAYETQIDILNVLLSYMRFFWDSKQKIQNNNNSALQEDSLKLYRSANIIHIIKEAFDTVVWEKGEIVDIDDSLYLRITDSEHHFFKKVGLIRTQEAAFSALMIFEKFGLENQQLKSTFKENFKKCIIKKIEISNRGKVRYQLSASEKESGISESYKQGIAQIITFYPHLTDEKIPQLKGLTIIDLMILHSKLSEMIEKIHEELKKIDVSCINKFNLKIKEGDLKNYLLQTTSFNISQVETYLALNESNLRGSNRINLWSRPLVKQEDNYHLLIPVLSSPNYLQLVDEWLESAGYSLKLRGDALEKFIKKDLLRFLKDKGEHVVPKEQIFTVSKKNPRR